MYDPQLGRWNVVDPLAEKFPGWSPYVAMANNPVMFVDPDGRDIIVISHPVRRPTSIDGNENNGNSEHNTFIDDYDDGGRLSTLHKDRFGNIIQRYQNAYRIMSSSQQEAKMIAAVRGFLIRSGLNGVRFFRRINVQPWLKKHWKRVGLKQER